jgi:tRNA(Arg) A34 adenosine deaminase TadA
MKHPTDQEIGFMREAIRLSEENVRSGKGGPFGVVVVKDGRIVATGVNTVTDTNDPTAHAEVNAIREACRVLGTFQLDGCDIYSSCEPCPMCLGAIYWARPARLFFANSREDAARILFDDAFIYEELVKSVDMRSLPTYRILSEEAARAFEMWEQSPDRKSY